MNIQQYLDCPQESVIDCFDSVVNEILQKPKQSLGVLIVMQEIFNDVEIRKKIRILQLIDELLSTNDKYLKQEIFELFHDLLTAYYEHQSKVQSNYLSQEDEVEMIELHVYVNKVLGYYQDINKDNITVQQARESIFNAISRASIVLGDDEFHQELLDPYSNRQEVGTQTEESKEIEQWKTKWELQVRYNQRLQRLNAKLREELKELARDDDEDQIIITEDNDNQDNQKQSRMKSKKQVQFQAPPNVVPYDAALFSHITIDQLPLFKKACLLSQHMLYDDKLIQILIQTGARQGSQIQYNLTYLNKSSTSADLSIKFTNSQPQPEIVNISLNPKQFVKQQISLSIQPCFMLIIYNNVKRTVSMPNYITKYLDFVSISEQNLLHKWQLMKSNKLNSEPFHSKVDFNEIGRYFQNGIYLNTAAFYLCTLQNEEILLKLKFNKECLKITIRSSCSGEILAKLIQQLQFLLKV